MVHLTRFEVIEGGEVTQEQLAQCALLYSEHYGIWAENAPSPLRPSTLPLALLRVADFDDSSADGRVKMTPKRLGKELLSNPDDTLLVMAFKDGKHVGHAFITRWQHHSGMPVLHVSGWKLNYGITRHIDSVAWVTQLVVHARHRRRYIATGMLSSIKGTKWFRSIGIVGIASSNAASCNTLAKLVRESHPYHSHPNAQH